MHSRKQKIHQFKLVYFWFRKQPALLSTDVQAGGIFFFQHRKKKAEAGSRVLSEIDMEYIFCLVTRTTK